MTGQVLDFTGSAHQAAFALLPWLVNGTLDADEQTQVEQHLQVCASCRRERAWLTQLAGAYSQGDVLVDADRAFARIVGRLAEDRDPALRHARSEPTSRWSRLVARWGETRGAWLRFAVAMQLGVIVALGWALLAGVPADYRTLGAPHGAVRAAGSLVVVFDPSATESDLSRILRDARAHIVDGPTAQGAYLIDVEGTPEALAGTLERLRAERAIKMVAPLVLEPAR